MSIFIIMYNEIEIKQKIEGVLSSCNSMKDASTKLGIGYRTLKKYATRFGLFRPNQSGKGIPSKLLQDVFSGKKTLGLQTLRKRLIQEKFLEYRCSCCSIESWQDSRSQGFCVAWIANRRSLVVLHGAQQWHLHHRSNGLSLQAKTHIHGIWYSDP